MCTCPTWPRDEEPEEKTRADTHSFVPYFRFNDVVEEKAKVAEETVTVCKAAATTMRF